MVCLGTGPSLAKVDVDYCQWKAPVIAISNAYKDAPWADILYSSDAKWWIWHNGVEDFTGWRITREREAAKHYGIGWIRSENKDGLSMQPDLLHNGFNSGYQAVNLAYHFGASTIVLLGYDMQATDGKNHNFGNHPDGRTPPFHYFLRAFNALPTWLADNNVNLRIINATRKTALTCFEQRDIQQCL